MIENRIETYKEKHCWQYDIRVRNLESDLLDCELTKEYVTSLKVSDFNFVAITDKKEQHLLKNMNG